MYGTTTIRSFKKKVFDSDKTTTTAQRRSKPIFLDRVCRSAPGDWSNRTIKLPQGSGALVGSEMTMA